MNADDRYSVLPNAVKQRIDSDFTAMLDDEADERWLKFRDESVAEWLRGQRVLTGRDPLSTLCDAHPAERVGV